ncbi:putative barnase/colicin E5 family endoribonuclease [Prevotella disiens]|uniref:putative barnase/colicin E5 family endoribonuclease n=1 Tax=Prevotella disiens TaxID=28130 RepID=UPI0011C19317|nr:hypothetical protein [Prevotella disiens]
MDVPVSDYDPRDGNEKWTIGGKEIEDTSLGANHIQFEDEEELIDFYEKNKDEIEERRKRADYYNNRRKVTAKVEETTEQELPLETEQQTTKESKQEIQQQEQQGNPINEDGTLKVEKVKQEPQPIGYGDFGAIYDQFKGKANEAIKFLLSKQDGEAIAALHHKDIGNIDLVWGKEGTAKSDGFGLAKLAKYHPEVLDNLQEILEDMIVTKRTDNRVQLESEKYQSAVRLTWDSKKKNWLLTMFEKKNSVLNNTTDTDKTQIGNENDTATLENAALSDGKDTEKTPNSKGNKKKVVSSHMEGNLFDEAPSLTNKDKDDEDNQRTRRENRRSDDGVSPRESSGRRTAEPGQLDANPTERRTERQGNSGVQSRNAEVRSSTGRPSGRLSRLNTTNNHAERGVDYAPTSVDARIEANIKAYR